MRLGRRSFLAGALSLAAQLAARPASAMGRTPVGGTITMRVPWATSSLDPHDLSDPLAAFFGPAMSDPVFALDGADRPYPTLASAMPTVEAGLTVVRLREGLRTARGAALSGADLIASIERARKLGAAAVLAAVPRPLARRGEALAVTFRAIDPVVLARALSSPLVALLPRDFSATSPDGTGAFRADVSRNKLLLKRNDRAARGGAYLDAIEVASASDLSASLRAFEAGRDDLGWLGSGLHDPRKGSVKFDLGRVGWVVLATGAAAGAFAAPGVAQLLVDALPPARLAHLGLGTPPSGVGDPRWGGSPAELLVDEASPHLIEIAETVAPIFSRPDHEVTVKRVARRELTRQRRSGAALLAIDVVRQVGPTPLDAFVSLASADDPERARDLVRHPPQVSEKTPVSSLTRALRLGVIGELRLRGGAIAQLSLPGAQPGQAWDLGAAFRSDAKP